MADPIRDTDDPGMIPRPESTAGTRPDTPRWVKVFGIIALILILMLAIMLLSGGNHGPGRHLSSSITAFGVQALA